MLFTHPSGRLKQLIGRKGAAEPDPVAVASAVPSPPSFMRLLIAERSVGVAASCKLCALADEIRIPLAATTSPGRHIIMLPAPALLLKVVNIRDTTKVIYRNPYFLLDEILGIFFQSAPS